MLRILVVEDEPWSRVAVEEALSDAGHQVVLSSDGLDGLEKSRREPFDLVISDIRLPGLNGLSLFEHLRSEAPHTDVILMTAHAELGDAISALKAGAFDYMLKPFELGELVLRIQRLSERRELLRDLSAVRTVLSERLGPYVLEHKIGEGGMGVVYRASHAMLRRPTAIKLLPPNRMAHGGFDRFEREVRLTCRLTHPNTIAIYDYGRAPDGAFYYAMELLNGANLADVLEHAGPLPEARVAHVMAQVCSALGEAHGVGLIHRDVKPANIQLCERGGIFDTVKVMDFGLVRQIEGGEAQGENPEMVVGTVPYLAPEVIRKAGAESPSSDIYAVGVVAYELLTGERPIRGNNAAAVMRGHVEVAPPPMSDIVGHAIDAKLESLVMQCLAKDPEARPGRCDVLSRSFRELELGEAWSEAKAAQWWQAHGAVFGAYEKRMAPEVTRLMGRAAAAQGDGS